MNEEAFPETYYRQQAKVRKEAARLIKRLAILCNGVHKEEVIAAACNEFFNHTYHEFQQSLGWCLVEIVHDAASEYKMGRYELYNQDFFKWCHDTCESVPKPRFTYLNINLIN